MRAFAQKQSQPQKTVSSSLARSNMATSGSAHCAHPILQLQGAIDNQAVQWVLQTHYEELKAGLTGTASSHFGRDFSLIPVHPPAAGAIQTKLAVNQPGNEYEQEADHVSQQVMRMPESQLQRACPCGGGCPECQTKQAGREHERMQTKHVQSSSQPLDSAIRGFMEPRFGQDFSRVRVHTDAKAVESSRALNALAYTVGEHVVFAPNCYDHATHAGRHLLAHELAHVVQQGGGAIALQRQPQQGGAEELSRDLLEISHELRGIGDKIEEGLEDLEIFRHQLFLAGKQMPKVGDRIDKATVAAFVEALVETSRTLPPFLPPGKRARTSVAKGLTIHEFREQLEGEDARLSHRVTPSVGQPHPTKRVKGFYHRATDSIHLTTDTQQGGDSKFGDG